MLRFVYIAFIILQCYAGIAQHKSATWSLYYENDSHELTKEHLAILDSIKNDTLKSIKTIVVKGYASSPADTLYNQELSERRANLVKEHLLNFQTISAQGYGEIDGKEALNRRVDIIVTYHSAEKKENDIKDSPGVINKLDEIAAGEKIELKGIHFYPGRDDIRNDSWPALRELLKYLLENKNIKFRLLGHVCCGKSHDPGRDGYNNRTGKSNLSEARAKRIYKYLLDNGIDKKRMSARGYAYRYPTGKGDNYDRRVEIEIISR